MGWFSSTSSSSSSNGNNSKSDSSNSDPFSHLSPEIRDFLSREAPIKPTALPTPTNGSDTAPTTPTSDKTSTAKSSKTPFDPTIYSAYGNKYADIWAQYRPQSQIEAAAQTPQMAVDAVYQSYRTRKAAITRAALENCAIENLELHQCWRDGGRWGVGTRGCTELSRKMESCFISQQDFLKTLGYMSQLGRTDEVEEKIQMHADKLYREQVRREIAIETMAVASENSSPEKSES